MLSSKPNKYRLKKKNICSIFKSEVNMQKVAIVGNIASGKSQVERIISNLGYPVADTDKINNKLLTEDLFIKEEIKKNFGENICDEKGNISKSQLGKIIFDNKEGKNKLESILHPKIFEKINDFFREQKNSILAFVSIPLLFETKREKEFDKIIFISCDEETRLQRLMKRNNFTKDEALKRMSSQGDEKEKIKKSDFVIYNNSDLNKLEEDVKTVINELIIR